MKFLVNGTLDGQPVEIEVEGEDRDDAKDELFHSIPMIDGKPLTRLPKVDLRTLRRAPETLSEARLQTADGEIINNPPPEDDSKSRVF